MPEGIPDQFALLRLTLTPGFGPVLIRRAVETLGSAEAVCEASASLLRTVRGVGEGKAKSMASGLRESEAAAQRELELAERLGVRILSMLDDDYPPLLRQLPDAPPILYMRGVLDAEHDRYTVAIVGSRNATAYGIEQAERFAYGLASAGLAVVSGGARGVDSAAHRAALRAGGRTIAVLGCGLAHCYPPENAELFERICAPGAPGTTGAPCTPGKDGETPRGAVLSELPLETPPDRQNFPRRNRIVAGMSLGVVVIEAPVGSGALITARLAVEDYGREAMAVPGRVDSPASEGALALLKGGGAAMVTAPADVLEILESPARHLHAGTHEARYADPAAEPEAPLPPSGESTPAPIAELKLTDTQRAVLGALSQPRTFDELVRDTGLNPERVRADATLLEIRRLVVRKGGALERARPASRAT